MKLKDSSSIPVCQIITFEGICYEIRKHVLFSELLKSTAPIHHFIKPKHNLYSVLSPFILVSSLIAANKPQSSQRDITPKSINDYLSLVWSHDTSQDKQETLGERLFPLYWFSEFSLHDKPLSRLLRWILQQKRSTFTPKIHFLCVRYWHCFFHHCDMVQSRSSILLPVTRMCIKMYHSKYKMSSSSVPGNMWHSQRISPTE